MKLRVIIVLFLVAILCQVVYAGDPFCTERIVNGDFGTETIAGWTGVRAIIVDGRDHGDYAVELVSEDEGSASLSQTINFTGVNYITFYAYADDPWGDTIGNLTIKANTTVLYDKQNIIIEDYVPYTIDVSSKKLTGNYILNFSVGPKYVNIFIDDISAISCQDNSKKKPCFPPMTYHHWKKPPRQSFYHYRV
jgi:hypothetical protein